ncbi:MAG TPA: class I SAM-dependent methyltransferase [Gemmatales bacterium]|nr:class I SAM-dependent methyltransferase [Gemmatales bacterium]
MQRVLRNVLRFPKRTWKGIRQISDPTYRFQRAADRVVPGWWAEPLYRQLLTLPGFTSRAELHLLVYLASLAPQQGVWVEIGAYKGRSTAWLIEAAQRMPHRPRVVSIDPHARDTWEPYSEVVRQFRLDKRGLETCRDFSSTVGQAWNRPIAYLWIDGSHHYPDVVQDIDLFVPHVVPGGYIVFDDAHGGNFPGVEQALRERMFPRPEVDHLGTLRHFEIFQKKPLINTLEPGCPV